MESSGTSLAVALCAQMEKSQRTFSLSSWNMDASPSRAPTANTFVETREVRLWAMAQPLMHLLFGSTDPFQSGSGRRTPFYQLKLSGLTGSIFLPVFIPAARCPIPCFVLFVCFFNWEEVNTLGRYGRVVMLVNVK